MKSIEKKFETCKQRLRVNVQKLLILILFWTMLCFQVCLLSNSKIH